MSFPTKIRHRFPLGYDREFIADSEYLTRMFRANGTTCEFPECPRGAVDFFHNEYTFSWICAIHRDELERGPVQNARVLAQGRMDSFLVWSYVHSNNESGFTLEVEVREKSDEIARVNKALEIGRDPYETASTVRARIKSFDSRPGIPDDSGKSDE